MSLSLLAAWLKQTALPTAIAIARLRVKIRRSSFINGLLHRMQYNAENSSGSRLRWRGMLATLHAKEVEDETVARLVQLDPTFLGMCVVPNLKFDVEQCYGHARDYAFWSAISSCVADRGCSLLGRGTQRGCADAR